MVEITRLRWRWRRRRRKTTFWSPPFTRSTVIAKGAPIKSKKSFVISMVKNSLTNPPTNFVVFSKLYIVIICVVQRVLLN